MKKRIFSVLFVFAVILSYAVSANAQTNEEIFARFDAQLKKANPQLTVHQEEMLQKVKPELDYYEKLKTCAPASVESDNALYRTIGVQNGICKFELNTRDAVTKREIPVCTVNAPISETREFASNKIKFANSLIGTQRLTTEEFNTIANQIQVFANKYCKQ